ncbi:hypothetical protein HK100_007961 [Physocladia obscura]|uniref:Uncharacterized protein n=1 Tax=Physocladia obscura TaxID=109957 RepID=A0AAD5TB13_9FUNG|nr:hypothetical protein HK100_007961 [Physocladia obscura]
MTSFSTQPPSSKVTPTQTQTHHESLVAHFPVRLLNASLSRHKVASEGCNYAKRRSYFDIEGIKTSTKEATGIKKETWRLFVWLFITQPLYIALARLHGRSFLRSHFGRAFFPHEFNRGVKRALPTLFANLSNWNGELYSDRPPNSSLSALKSSQINQLPNLLAPSLLRAFSVFHKDLTSKGYRISFDWEYIKPSWYYDSFTASLVRPKFIWITFGSAKNAMSTLLPGPVIKRYNSAVFSKLVDEYGDVEPKQQQNRKIIHREMIFEFVYEIKDLKQASGTDGSDPRTTVFPDFQFKSKLMNTGQRVAVDSVVYGFVVEYKVFRISDGIVVEQGFADLDSIAIRMESSYFSNGIFPDDGTWKIADIDSFLISQRIAEEEVDS